jgi:hypothetical protein
VAEVWMDEWRDFYYQMNPGLGSILEIRWAKLIVTNN